MGGAENWTVLWARCYYDEGQGVSFLWSHKRYGHTPNRVIRLKERMHYFCITSQLKMVLQSSQIRNGVKSDGIVSVCCNPF